MFSAQCARFQLKLKLNVTKNGNALNVYLVTLLVLVLSFQMRMQGLCKARIPKETSAGVV